MYKRQGRGLERAFGDIKKGPAVYITRWGVCYHQWGCRYLAKSRIAADLSRLSEAYRPCEVCRPPSVSYTHLGKRRLRGEIRPFASKLSRGVEQICSWLPRFMRYRDRCVPDARHLSELGTNFLFDPTAWFARRGVREVYKRQVSWPPG